VPAEWAPRDPECQGEDAHDEFNVGDAGSDLALRARDDRGSSLVGSSGVHGIVTIDLMTSDQRFILQRVLDLDGWGLKKGPLPLAVTPAGHSKPSMAAASSR